MNRRRVVSSTKKGKKMKRVKVITKTGKTLPVLDCLILHPPPELPDKVSSQLSVSFISVFVGCRSKVTSRPINLRSELFREISTVGRF